MSTINLRELDPTLRELARTNCKEDANTVVEQILTIQEWIKKSPHLKASSHPQLILAFLRRCRFSLEETKKRIDDYYSLKSAFPDVLGERDLTDELLEFYRSGIHIIPNKPIAPDGSAVMISQYCKIDSKKSNPRLAFKLLFLLFETLAMENDNASIVGLTYIIDCRDVGVELMMQFDPFLLKKCYTAAEYCMPLKLNEVHVINMRGEGVSVFKFISSFMPSSLSFKVFSKIRYNKGYEMISIVNRLQKGIELIVTGNVGTNLRSLFIIVNEKNLKFIFINIKNFSPDRVLRPKVHKTLWKQKAHKKAEDLLEHIPRDAVTVEYGGSNGYVTEAIKTFEAKLLKYKDHFKVDSSYGTNEKLRIGNRKEWQMGELSGVSGSFRKLELD